MQNAKLKNERIKERIMEVNKEIAGKASKISLFSNDAKFNSIEIMEKTDWRGSAEKCTYGLPILNFCADNEIENRKKLAYPFTAYKSLLNSEEIAASANEIFKNLKSATLSKADFAFVPKNRALFFAGTKCLFNNEEDFKNHCNGDHFKTLFGDKFNIEDICIDGVNLSSNFKKEESKKSNKEKIFKNKGKQNKGEQNKGEQNKCFPDPFIIKNLISRKYGRISLYDLFCNVDSCWCMINKNLKKYNDVYLYYDTFYFWSAISELFASRCVGEILTLTGQKPNFFDKNRKDEYITEEGEMYRLLNNTNVTSITEINIRYPELPARIIIPNNNNSKETNIAIFDDKVNDILKYILKSYKCGNKNSIIIIDFGISEYLNEEDTYKNLGKRCNTNTIFLDVKEELKKNKCNSRDSFNQAIKDRILSYFKDKDEITYKGILNLIKSGKSEKNEGEQVHSESSTQSSEDEEEKRNINTIKYEPEANSGRKHPKQIISTIEPGIEYRK